MSVGQEATVQTQDKTSCCSSNCRATNFFVLYQKGSYNCMSSGLFIWGITSKAQPRALIPSRYGNPQPTEGQLWRNTMGNRGAEFPANIKQPLYKQIGNKS